VLEILVACTAMLAAAGGAAAAAGLARQRRKTAAQALERYARSRDLRFAEDRATSAPRIDGVEAGIAFAIDLVRLDGRACTRVVACAPRGRCMKLRLAPSAAGPARLRAEDPAALREPLGQREGALRILGARDGVWVASDGARVVCAWPGVDGDASLLDAARALVVTLAETRVAEAPYR
jgi:hypothetical protein